MIALVLLSLPFQSYPQYFKKEIRTLKSDVRSHNFEFNHSNFSFSFFSSFLSNILLNCLFY